MGRSAAVLSLHSSRVSLGLAISAGATVNRPRGPQADRVIECFVDREIEVDGKQYATLMPADTPVILAGYKDVNGTKQLMPILDEPTIDRLFDTASAVLAEVDLLLSRSAVVLTVEGHGSDDSDDESDEDGLFAVAGDEDEDDDDGPEFDTSDDDELLSQLFIATKQKGVDVPLPAPHAPDAPPGLRAEELVDRAALAGGAGGFGGADVFGRVREMDGADEHSEDSDGGDNEQVQVLATFFSDGEKFVVAAPLEPVLIIGSPAPREEDPSARALGQLEALGVTLPAPDGGKDGVKDGGKDGGEDGGEDSGEEGGGVYGEYGMGAQYLLPDKEELERVTPRIEKELETIWDNEDKERRNLMRLRENLISQWGRAD